MYKSILGAMLASALSLMPPALQAQPAFVAPLDEPSALAPAALKAPLNSLVLAGTRLIAAGQRGHILFSDDGATWVQAQVPVSSDLTALFFSSANQGWAVGHEGVILHSSNGGGNWTRQLDGRQIARLLLERYGSPANAEDAEAARLQRDAEQFASQGANQPLLDVWFEDDRKGFAVGAFNLILHTEDGGAHWTPWLEHIENPRAMHLYGIRPAAGGLFIVGEQGLVLKFDKARQRFLPVHLPYQGTLFGVIGNDRVVLVYGLRGNALRSVDGGASWQKVETGVNAGLTSAGVLTDGSFVLVSQAGHVLRSSDEGATFQRVKTDAMTSNFAVSAAPGAKLALAGTRGVRLLALQ